MRKDDVDDREMKYAKGFTLLEVLVSLAILMVGLLGIAGLMVKGQRASFEAFQRQQALAIASDIAEKIRSNEGGAPFFVTDTLAETDIPGQGVLLAAINDCMGGTCDRAALAQFELALWDGLLAGASETTDAGATRVGGIMGARGCVDWDGNTNQPVFRISVAWQGDAETVAPAAVMDATVCGFGKYGSDKRHRLVTIDVATCRLNAVAPWGCAS